MKIIAKHAKICLVCIPKVKKGQKIYLHGQNPKVPKSENSMGKNTWEVSKKSDFLGHLDSSHVN